MLSASSLKQINTIESLLIDKNLDAASLLSNQYAASFPHCPANLYTAGLINLLNSEYEQAIAAFNQVIDIFGCNAKFHTNLGIAYKNTGNLDQSLVSFNCALELDQNNEMALYNLACTQLVCDQELAALETVNKLLAIQPNNSHYIATKADVLRLLKRFKQAANWYHKCLSLDENHMAANSNLSVILVSFGQLELALKHANKAVNLNPDNSLAQLNLGRCLARLEKFDEAMEVFAKAYELNADSLELTVEIADVWMVTGDLNEAEQWFNKAESISPGYAATQIGLAKIMLNNGQVQNAINLLEAHLEQEPDNPEVIKTYADALWDDGNVNGAIETLKIISPDDNENPQLLAKSAQMLASAGEVELAMDYYEKALSLSPLCIPALSGLAIKQRAAFKHDYAQRMHQLLESPVLGSKQRANIHNGLAYYFDGNKAWEQATDHMKKANELQWSNAIKRDWDYDRNKHKIHFNQIKHTFTQQYFDHLSSTFETEAPVFIVAMPRSGTTLTEQILARHPSILGVGERNFVAQSLQQLATNAEQKPLTALKSLTDRKLQSLRSDYLSILNTLKIKNGKPNAIRVVDKMPDNYSQIGWILTLFPKAKIIHCRRDPRSVALSCWMTQFGKIQWASRWSDLIDRIHQYQNMMNHWRQVVPGRFLEIDYEDLVENQEAVSRKMIKFIGLEWDEKCLKFYESDEIVRTASITQVRQPIYKKSLARWKKYQHHIPELNEINIESD